MGSEIGVDYMEIREMKEGEAGLVVYFHYKVAKKAYNFNPLMEKEFLEIMCEYFNDKENKYWVIEENGEILGSLGVDKISENEAQLRLFATDQSIQGRGAGKKLVKTALDYSRAIGIKHVILETIDICKVARHIYSSFGFKLVEKIREDNESADYPIVEERWKLDL
ncbi:GNAT family N-acetyltransferase [Methanobrevibacter woesei]|uniref:GNAT family N-acetyltransferase n=1 Tax=Methanobrevibacter woesei TaxID=190976 RepID=UPI0024B7BDE9|nr:GNAT family N-acetyltransferase [Methanobrevibacter woesei]